MRDQRMIGRESALPSSVTRAVGMVVLMCGLLLTGPAPWSGSACVVHEEGSPALPCQEACTCVSHLDEEDEHWPLLGDDCMGFDEEGSAGEVAAGCCAAAGSPCFDAACRRQCFVRSFVFDACAGCDSSTHLWFDQNGYGQEELVPGEWGTPTFGEIALACPGSPLHFFDYHLCWSGGIASPLYLSDFDMSCDGCLPN